MIYSIQTVCGVIDGKMIGETGNAAIEHLIYDSRRIQQPASSVFFALKTEHNDGHKYLRDAYKKGVRNFVISEQAAADVLRDCNLILVGDTLEALQKLAAFHRSHFSIPIIGITGSNGKTIIKEWLFQLLQDDHRIVRSPKSFNSQIGVALSVWQMNEQHTLGIFEAGISKPGEMERLATMIRPTIGLLSNIGEAHSEGFLDKDQKIAEKVMLFANADIVIARSKDLGGRSKLIEGNTRLLTWGHAANNDFVIEITGKQNEKTEISILHNSVAHKINIPFVDHASVENGISCCCIMLILGYNGRVINERIAKLNAIDMRLQLNHSINDCLVINDSYSADITSLNIALDFLKQQSSGLTRTLILSEFLESGKSEEQLHAEVASLVHTYGIKKLLVIGEKIKGIEDYLNRSVAFHAFLSTDDFIKEFRGSQFFKEVILIKGARRFEFERIAKLFEKKLHQTVLEINLNALAHNLKEYQKLLKPETKLMAMVKAFSYGSGGAEIASVLQYHNANYLGVAYADEGVELVKAGISLPIMVMNAEESSFQSIVDYNLQPVMYSFDLLDHFENYLKEQGLESYPVHVEIETGMNRLGFSTDQVRRLADRLKNTTSFHVLSVFSHLAASEDPMQDDFTFQQSVVFQNSTQLLEEYLAYPFLKHISNSAAIVRHPQLQMDMVRLGIGLYGIEIDNHHQLDLHAVATLRSTIAQIRQIKKGDSVSYNRKGVVNRDSLIATVRIGYADGYSRQFSNGKGKMLIHAQHAPVVGTVCMDMTMVDVTDIAGVKEGDEVIIFGPQLSVQQVAAWIDTIPYELMTGVSQRVKRIYFHE